MAYKTGFTFEKVGEIGIYRLPSFSKCAGIDHGFSAKTGGVSTGDYASLNLSFTREEERDNVMENYKLFCRAAKIPVGSMIMDTYEHGTTVRTVTAKDRGRGYTLPPLPFCDGLVTNDPEVTLMTGHADCMAFYCYDKTTRSIGLAHAGWRGALNRIGTELVGRMVSEFGANPADIIAGVGPSICPRCFEVGDDVAEQFEKAFSGLDIRGENKRGKAVIDLWQVAAKQFIEAGVRAENIEIMGVCTMEDERLYSHRRDRGKTGGMTAFLRLV
ncbi:MAG: peptidoglycan editing factor PgeF [Clostridia bacterium]|nr:peptidoglycan editing factor PgeF [Clostridia bacterium]